MGRPLRIGVSGFKGAGKDVIANYLIAAHGFRRLALADPMKEMVHAGLGIPLEVLHGSPEAKEAPWRSGKSPRQILQTLGTEWGRDMVSDRLWLDLALERTIPAWEAEHGPTSWVLPDVRFPNEAAVLREHGFTIWRVNRPGCTGDDHASETEMARIEADYTLTNDDTLDSLYRQVDILLSFMDPQ